MSKVEKLVLKNYLIEPLIRLLDRQELKSKMSRARFRVITLLLERANTNERARIELVNKYGKKDDKGKVIIENGRFVFEDEETFNTEFNTLVKEDAVFDVLPSNEDDFEVVRGILENSNDKFSNITSPSYREFEEIKEALTK